MQWRTWVWAASLSGRFVPSNALLHESHGINLAMEEVVEDREGGFNALGRIESSQNDRNITRYAYVRSLTAGRVP